MSRKRKSKHRKQTNNQKVILQQNGTAVVLEGVQKLTAGLMQACRKAVACQLPNSLTEIANRSFAGFAQLVQIKVPDNVRKVGDESFKGCTSLRDVRLPDGLSSLPRAMFQDCRSLEQLSLPKNCVVLPERFLFGCSQLQELRASARLKLIGADAFRGDTRLRRLRFGDDDVPADGVLICPSSLKQIDQSAFRDCQSIESVTLNAGLQRMGQEAFRGCVELRTLVVLGARTIFGINALRDTATDLKVEWRALQDEPVNRAKLGFPDAHGFFLEGDVLTGYEGDARKIVIPEGVQVIAKNIFPKTNRKSKYYEVVFPESVRRIEPNPLFLQFQAPSKPPKGYFRNGTMLPADYTTQLIKRRWKDNLDLEDWAALYLFQEGKLMELGVENLEKFTAGDIITAMAELLPGKQNCRARLRAAAFCVENSRSITQVVQGRLADRLADGAAWRPAKRGLFPAPILDAVLAACRARKGAEADFAKLVSGWSEDQNAPALLVKNAIVPYMVQAMAAKPAKSEYLHPYMVPEAEMAAAQIAPEKLHYVLHNLQSRLAEPAVTYLAIGRFGSASQAAEMIQASFADRWGSMVVPETSIAKGACLLGETAPTLKVVEEAPVWNGYMAAYANLHKQPETALPALPRCFDRAADDTFRLKAGSEMLEVRLLDGLEIEISNGKKKWKRLPKTLPVQPEDLNTLRADLDSLTAYLEMIRHYVDGPFWESYLSGKKISLERFTELAADPIGRRALSGIVFSQGQKTFMIADGKTIGSDSAVAKISEVGGIVPAHVLEMSDEEIEAWRSLFRQKGWSSWMQQLEEPRYEAREIDPNRFLFQHVALTTIADLRSRSFMYDAIYELNHGLQGNSSVALVGRHKSEFTLSDIRVQHVDRKFNRILYHLDQMTALARVREKDESILKWYRTANNARLNNAVREAIKEGETSFVAALLAIQNERRTGRKNRVADLSI